MKKRVKDIESVADTLGVDLGSHMSFGIGKPPITLTPIIAQQASPENVVDNFDKRV